MPDADLRRWMDQPQNIYQPSGEAVPVAEQEERARGFKVPDSIRRPR